MNRRLLLSLLMVLPFAVAKAQASGMMIMDAQARASLTPTAKSGAVYMMLMNHGAEEDALVAITSDAAASARIHETQMDGDIMKMRPLEKLAIKPHENIILAPGQLHIMLEGLKAPLVDGSTLHLTLTFEKAGEIKVDVPVQKMTAMQGMDHDMESMETPQ